MTMFEHLFDHQPRVEQQQQKQPQLFLAAVIPSYPSQVRHLDHTYNQAAYTEASFVTCSSDAFTAAVARLYEGAVVMEPESERTLKRTASHQSHGSLRSQRSPARRPARKYSSYISSSGSSIAESDKSLTSFPSLTPESPKPENTFPALLTEHIVSESPRKPSAATPSIVESLTAGSPSQTGRNALFDDAPLATQKVPGSLHSASDEHIKRLIARTGPVALVRQFAGDLAQRDAQIALFRRKAEERERALKKIIIECGLSNMDLEKRLRSIEERSKLKDDLNTSITANAPLEDLLSTAMCDSTDDKPVDPDATIKAAEVRKGSKSSSIKGTQKGWFNIWGGASKKTPSGSINGDHEPDTVVARPASGRKTVLRDDIFDAPETDSVRSSSRGSTAPVKRPAPLERRISSTLASMALKLVAGNSNRADSGVVGRGRANSASERVRAPSTGSARTSMSNKTTAHATGGSPSARRKTLAIATLPSPANRSGQERWDTMMSSPQSSTSGNLENYGPVEMDAILPPETQPPTVTQAYNNNQWNPEFLTDRYGFIYDQRRKRRQREAIETMKKTKRGNRLEMLSSGARGNISPTYIDETDAEFMDDRPDTPISLEESDKPKRWQDFLKIATNSGTELLSHTPLTSAPVMEILEGGGSVPPSPGITTEERGFLPTAHTVTQSELSGIADNATLSKPADVSTTDALRKEDVEPVKLLLAQLGDVHDSIQQARTVKWNDFLRKVRAERRREGEAAAAALASTTDTRSHRAMAVMPEAALADGELIGVAGLGLKGKMGRNKATEFKGLVLGGIPVANRAKIWAECSGALAMRIPGYYEDLVAHRVGGDDPVIVAQIQMDIHRTLTDNIFFRRGPGVAKLNEVLLAYSRRNAEVGYCQGMNLITACLLLIMPTAEDAFWLLCTIIENILPRGYFDHSLLASRADQQVLRQYVSEILPRLSLHLEDLGIELEALTFQWFLSVFTDCLSAEALFRVWDVVLCINDGSTFLFQVALALLKLNEQQLLKCDSPAGIYTYINHQMTNHAISIDGLIQASEGLRKVVKREDVEVRRKKAIDAESDLIRQREAKNNLRRKERLAASAAGNEESLHQDRGQPDDSVRVNGGNGDSRRSSYQLGLGEDDYGELTIRTPMPVDEEVSLALS